MKLQSIVSAGLLGALSVFYSASSYAYLDPGTASIIIQGTIAAIAGAAVTLKLYWHRIKTIFTKSSKKPEEVNGSVDDAGEDDSQH